MGTLFRGLAGSGQGWGVGGVERKYNIGKVDFIRNKLSFFTMVITLVNLKTSSITHYILIGH